MDGSEQVRFSIATDVGCIELIQASFNRRGVAPHMHDQYSISVPLYGGLAFDYRGAKHVAASGVISCTPPGEVHNAYAARGERWEFLCLLIPVPQVVAVLESGETRLPDLPNRVVVDPDLARRVIALHKRLETAGDLLERQSACALVLTDFFRKHSSAKAHVAPYHPVQQAREMLHGCFAEQVPLDRLAAHVGLSPYHFLRRFRATVGLTPHTYLNQIRVLEAKRRLAIGMSAAETALVCGFYDQSHMARQFKRAALVTPGQYQNAFKRLT